MTGGNPSLADALIRLAEQIEQNKGSVIGEQTVVTVGPGSGNVVGSKTTVTIEPGFTGSVIGKSISVSSGDANPAALEVAKELREAASTAQSSPVPRPWLEGLLNRAGGLANAVVTAAAREGVVEAIRNMST